MLHVCCAGNVKKNLFPLQIARVSCARWVQMTFNLKLVSVNEANMASEGSD